MTLTFAPRRKTVQDYKDFLLLFSIIGLLSSFASLFFSVSPLYAVVGAAYLTLALGLSFGVRNLNKRLFVSLEEILRKENLVLTHAKSLDFRKNYELSLKDIDTQEHFIGDLPGFALDNSHKRTLYIQNRKPVASREFISMKAHPLTFTVDSDAQSGLCV